MNRWDRKLETLLPDACGKGPSSASTLQPNASKGHVFNLVVNSINAYSSHWSESFMAQDAILCKPLSFSKSPIVGTLMQTISLIHKSLREILTYVAKPFFIDVKNRLNLAYRLSSASRTHRLRHSS